MKDMLRNLVESTMSEEQRQTEAVRAWAEAAPQQVEAVRNWLNRRLAEAWSTFDFPSLLDLEGDFDASTLPQVLQRRLAVDTLPLVEALVQRGLGDRNAVARQVLEVARLDGWVGWGNEQGDARGLLICPSREILEDAGLVAPSGQDPLEAIRARVEDLSLAVFRMHAEMRAKKGIGAPSVDARGQVHPSEARPPERVHGPSGEPLIPGTYAQFDGDGVSAIAQEGPADESLSSSPSDAP